LPGKLDKEYRDSDLWAREQGYTTHSINFFKMPNGDLIVSLPERNTLRIPAQDELGTTVV